MRNFKAGDMVIISKSLYGSIEVPSIPAYTKGEIIQVHMGFSIVRFLISGKSIDKLVINNYLW